MNEPILSPEESAALMEALQEGGAQKEAAIVEIDLTGGERPLRAAQPHIEKLGAQLAAAWRRTLATTYRLSCELIAEPSEIMSFGDLRRRLEGGTILGRLESLSSSSPVLMTLGPTFISAVVDYGFGGSGEDTSSLASRDPTALERNLLRRLCMLLAADVTSTWQREAPIELSFLHLEGRNDISTLMPEGTALLFIPFRLNFNDNQDEIALALTAGSVDAIARIAPKDPQPADKDIDSDLIKRLSNWPIWVSAELGRCSLTVDEVLDLSPGSVLRLESMAHEPIQILLNGVAKLIGRPVISSGSLSTQIEGWLGESPEEEDNDVEQPNAEPAEPGDA